MQITFVGHASILIETKGVRILSDPWWRGPCFGAQWWSYPPAFTEAVQPRVGYIYISHGHHDHLHSATLKSLNRDTVVLVSRNIDIAPTIRDLGFVVIEIGDQEEYALAEGVKCRIIETHTADTLFAIDDGERVCLNLNDALHAAPESVQERFFGLLHSLYPKVDYVFCGYGVASHFPNCYRIPNKNEAASAAKRQAYFNRQWVKIIKALDPQFGFPFAADVAFLERDLLWVNEPTHNAERPTSVFTSAYPKSSTVVKDIAPGFQITGSEITRPFLRQPTSLAQLQEEYADQFVRANSYGSASEEDFGEVLRLLAANVHVCRSYLLEYPGDYQFVIQFRNFLDAITIAKRGNDVSVERQRENSGEKFDVRYITRLHYIKWSLSSRYGHEILFVGSGGIFEYASAAIARKNLHRELMTVLIPHDLAPSSRFGNSSPAVYRLKRTIKGWLGRRSVDLYDLNKWTVWRKQGEASVPRESAASR